MKTTFCCLLLLLFLCLVKGQANINCTSTSGQTLYDFNAVTLGGQNITFSQYKGRVMLVANVASFWGLTVINYTEFNALLALFPDPAVFNIIGFPCSQFYNQEPGTNGEILNCLKYVRPGNNFVPNFTLFQLSDVNGASTSPLYSFLKGACPQPSMYLPSPQFIDWQPVSPADITWNFEKFLITKQGVPYKRYNPPSNPLSLVDDIKFLINQK